jgi:hypothetical protein
MSKRLLQLWSWFKKLPSRLLYVKYLFGGSLAIGKAELSMVVIRADGTVEDRGVVSRKKVTGAFVTDIVNCLSKTAPYNASAAVFQDYKYHDCGTGVTAEANTQTALVTPYGGARATGTQVAGGTATAPTYTSVATISFTGTLAITEHAIFNASTVGTMMDRSVFAAVNVINGDSIQFTYVLTINAEA